MGKLQAVVEFLWAEMSTGPRETYYAKYSGGGEDVTARCESNVHVSWASITDKAGGAATSLLIKYTHKTHR